MEDEADDAADHADHELADDTDGAAADDGSAADAPVGLVDADSFDAAAIHTMDDQMFTGEFDLDTHLPIAQEALDVITDAGAEASYPDLVGHLKDLIAALEAGDVESASVAAQWFTSCPATTPTSAADRRRGGHPSRRSARAHLGALAGRDEHDRRWVVGVDDVRGVPDASS